MVIVDEARCAYCGGCVSVCPVEALSLAETQLTVSEECIECGDCASACPVSALHTPDASGVSASALETSRSFWRRYDLVVVGAGPGGSTAARVAAQAGLSVLLIEKRQEIGAPVRCAEGVGHDALAQFIEPDLRWIAAEVNQAEVITIPDFSQWRRDKGAARTWRGAGGRGYILERRVFDRALAERAAQAGAEVRVKTAATALLMEDRRVRGIEIRRSDFLPPSTGSGQALTGTSRGPDCNAGTVEVEAQVVIAADGIEAQVGRWAGLDLQLPLKDTMVCVQYLLAGIEVDPTCTRYTLCHELAPGGYAWVFPKGEGKANVGLGVQADLWKDVLARSRPGPAARGENAAGRGAVLDLLHRFIESDPRLVRGYPVTLIAGNVPVALPPSRLVADGLMLAGDAARQVDPLTGGGIINAMAAGQLAAEVAVAAIAAGDTSAASLARYQEMWQGSVGRKMERNYRLREKFLPAQRADERFMRAFALAIS